VSKPKTTKVMAQSTREKFQAMLSCSGRLHNPWTLTAHW